MALNGDLEITGLDSDDIQMIIEGLDRWQGDVKAERARLAPVGATYHSTGILIGQLDELAREIATQHPTTN